MMDKSVLFVGLDEEQLGAIPLPDGVDAEAVETAREAIDHIALTPSDLIVANDRIGDQDSVDFFAQIAEVDPESSTPVIFLAAPETGVQPFLYQRRRVGFDVRYLDAEGELRSYFINEPHTEKAFRVRAIQPGGLGDEIARVLVDGNADTGEAESREGLWEIGFNQDVAAGGITYHIQTEVVAVDPIAVTTTVFAAGKALHSQRQKVSGKLTSVDDARLRIEAVHADMVGRVSAGEIER